MDYRIVIAGVVGVVFLLLLIRLLSNNSKTRKFLSMGQFLFCIIVLGVIIAFCLGLIGTKIYRNGIGELFTDYAEIKATPNGGDDKTEGAGGDTLIIVVSLDEIHIEKSVYPNVSEAQQKIAEAVASGKNLRVIDDYALATTYNELIDSIINMNVSRSSIEEIKQP